MKSVIIVIYFFIIGSLVGCGSARVRSFAKIDKSDKSILIGTGGGVLAEIRYALKKRGWQVKNNWSKKVTRTTHGKNKGDQVSTTQDETTFRYSLQGRWQSDSCMTCNCLRSYWFSIIDNKNGEEVVTFTKNAPNRMTDGTANYECEESVVERIIDWIDKN